MHVIAWSVPRSVDKNIASATVVPVNDVFSCLNI